MSDAGSATYVGLMSGTSLDGIAAAVVRFADTEDDSTHELLGFVLHPYTDERRDRLRHAMVEGTADEYCRLGFDVGAWLAEAAEAALLESGVAREEIRAIGSHGQTLWHVPRRATWQIGEAAVIAERTGIGVVSGFRVRDVAAGGEGAPLVPAADVALYRSRTGWRALQNVGGMANVTVVPPDGELRSVRAFDTGPGVAVVDAVVRRLYPGLPYDVDGRIAAEGRWDERVVAALLADPYFAQEPPKSTGREHFGDVYAGRLLQLCREHGCDDAGVVATAVQLTARSIADGYRRFVAEPVAEVVVSGGGAKHPVLLQAIREALAPRAVVAFDELYYDGEAKEAVAFALLAHLHCTGRPGNVIAATGARGPRILGVWTPT